MASTVREGAHAVKPGAGHRRMFGKLGEGLALLFYILQGWWPARRLARELVQTDLVLQRGETLLLVEVKARMRPLPYERLVGPAQQRRLAQQAVRWAARHPHFTVQLEVIQITPSWPLVRRYASALA